MQLDILAVGRLKAGPERDLYDRYSQRIAKAGRQLQFSGPDLSEFAESRAGDAEVRKREEASLILEKLDNSARLIVLD